MVPNAMSRVSTAAFHISTKVVTSVGVSVKRENFDKTLVVLMYWDLPATGFILNSPDVIGVYLEVRVLVV